MKFVVNKVYIPDGFSQGILFTSLIPSTHFIFPSFNLSYSIVKNRMEWSFRGTVSFRCWYKKCLGLRALVLIRYASGKGPDRQGWGRVAYLSASESRMFTQTTSVNWIFTSRSMHICRFEMFTEEKFQQTIVHSLRAIPLNETLTYIFYYVLSLYKID